jgi:hypothetical protein
MDRGKEERRCKFLGSMIILYILNNDTEMTSRKSNKQRQTTNPADLEATQSNSRKD